MVALLGWVIVAVVTAELFWWIVGGAAIACVGWLIYREWETRLWERLAADVENAEIIARADEQHALALAGDPRGTYGIYPPSPLVWPGAGPASLR
ncbi:hypothetical protein [Mycolicibacterium fluoranthenivorans]|uniref:Uncharacterized protein n=1 Tax=Mycolicibacterium fluoranthenivorans TaxID=258505 RepID=A0A7X5U5R2_9MYCO|nr:hypothetical protein [Mycolicibacterium fluoranthenivorans]MCV7354520.1 hypothetical protein [Mycolicibacterium fluoranthenivorans]NIH98873.1 hypothetical protein [Mycolicibacterium fluoranthenivorans]